MSARTGHSGVSLVWLCSSGQSVIDGEYLACGSRSTSRNSYYRLGCYNALLSKSKVQLKQDNQYNNLLKTK